MGAQAWMASSENPSGALIIVFFKAEAFNFQFHAELGAYGFALGALLSSLAVTLLKRDAKSE